MVGHSLLVFRIIVFVFAFFLYANTIPNEYSHGSWRVTNDNSPFTKSNSQVAKGIDGIPEIWTSRYTKGDNISFGYRPIAETTYALEYEFFGQNPHISHFINVFLYSILCVILFQFLLILFPSSSKLFPLFTCLIFAAHPIHVDVVASLKNREEILMMLFAFLSSLALITSYHHPKQKKLYWSISFLFLILATLSKSNAAIFAVLIPFTLYFSHYATLKQSFFIAFKLAIICVVTYFIPSTFLPPVERTFYFWEFPAYHSDDVFIKIGTALNALLFNFKLLLYPFEQGFYYGYNVVPLQSLFNIKPFLSLIIYAAIISAGIFTFQKRTLLAYGIWFFLISISVLSNVILPLPGIVANRWLFLPSFGFCIVIGWGIVQIRNFSPWMHTRHKQLKVLSSVMLALLLIPYCTKTIARNQAWENYDTLYEHDIKHLHNSAKAQSMVGHHLFRKANRARDAERKRLAKQSLKHLKRAVAIYPDYKNVWNALGTIYFKTGKYDKAIHAFNTILRIDSTYELAYGNLASAFHAAGYYKKAEKWYLRAIEKRPKDLTLYKNLGDLYLKEGKLQEALKLNQRLLERFPDNHEALKTQKQLKKKIDSLKN